MQLTCPCCDVEFPIEAGFADDDGKRLAAVMAEFEPALGRSVLRYLRLFKPAKTALRSARAAKLVRELAELVKAGTVCRDERTGLRRPASAAVWSVGIEQMLASRATLTLPLENHNYLRAVVFGLADHADAQAEQAREQARRTPRRTSDGPSPVRPGEDPLQATLAWLAQMREYGHLDENEYAARIAAARSEGDERPE